MRSFAARSTGEIPAKREISDFLYLDDDTIRGWLKPLSAKKWFWDALAFDGLERRSVPYDAGTGGCVVRLLEARFLSLDCRDQGPVSQLVRSLTTPNSGCIKLWPDWAF